MDKIPFAALCLNSDTAVVDRWPVTVVSSIGVYAELAKNAVPAGAVTDVLAVGNPAVPAQARVPGLGRVALPPLVHAEREARAVAARYAGHPPLIGAQATKPAVLDRLAECHLAHFATHGVLGADGAPGAGALCLTPTVDDDGYLRASDLAGMDLSGCRMVVLSACRSGWGRSSAEGSLGLARTFLAAGVRAVVVSLWSIYDDFTADFMIGLHEALASGLPVDEALRREMVAARDAGRPATDWAAFTLVGDLRVVLA